MILLVVILMLPQLLSKIGTDPPTSKENFADSYCKWTTRLRETIHNPRMPLGKRHLFFFDPHAPVQKRLVVGVVGLGHDAAGLGPRAFDTQTYLSGRVLK